jgi:hypothetical protein
MQEETIKENSNNETEKPQNEPDKLEECKKKCEEYLNNWKRSTADFINYKKDEMARLAFLGQYAKEDIILKILPILDNITLAEKQLPEKLKKGEEGSQESIEWTKGFLQIQNQIKDFLKKEGIEVKELEESETEETTEVEAEASEADTKRSTQSTTISLNTKRSLKVSIQRYKGLGEMNPEELWETTMDPGKRTLKKVTVEDVQEADKIFDILMGEDVPSRKSFIQSNATKATLDI